MRFKIGRLIFRRFTEIFLTNAVLSVFVTFLHIAEVLVTDNALYLALSISTLLFVFINIKTARQYYLEIKDNKIYFLTGILAYMLFADLSLFIYVFGFSKLFTWFFAITKFAKYTSLQTSSFISILIFHGIGLATVIFAPIGMKRVSSKDDIILTDE